MLYAYTQEQMQKLMNYLVKRPYEESYALIDMLQQGVPVDIHAPSADEKSADVKEDEPGLTD